MIIEDSIPQNENIAATIPEDKQLDIYKPKFGPKDVLQFNREMLAKERTRGKTELRENIEQNDYFNMVYNVKTNPDNNTIEATA